jgi:hypothetical protein
MEVCGEEGAAGALRDSAIAAAANASRVVVEPVDPSGPGERLVALVDGLVAETPDGVDLLRGWRSTWAGQPIEVHDVATRWGRCSFVMRWHGARPALLWEVVPGEGRSSVPVVRAAALDPALADRSRTGETLLAAPTLAGADGPRG